MAIRAGILCFKSQIEFPHRLLLMSGARTKCAITCLQKRDASSSVPVRYIPKTSSKVKKLEISQRTKGSEEREVGEFSGVKTHKSKVKHCGKDTVHKNRDLYEKPRIQNQIRCSNSLFSSDGQQESPEVEDGIDHLLRAAGNELVEEPEEVYEELNTRQVKNHREKDVSGVSKTQHGAEKAAIELLAAKAFTTVELRKKLSGKNFSPDTIEAVINDFTSRGMLNDSLYAEVFSRSRWSSSSWGPMRIKKALFTKGVSKVDAEKAVKLVFEDGGEVDEDEELIHGLSKPSMDQLFVQASKQWLRGQEVPKEKRKSRIVHWLQYRGFDWDVIGFILKKLESQYPTQEGTMRISHFHSM